jgi:adenylate cyclase
VLHFFASELFLRPVLAHIHEYLPDDFEATARGVPLRWKLLGALPVINVITGVVVSGLSTSGQASLEDLGLDVLVAVVVAFTISFELTLLVTKSVLDPVGDLLRATDKVKRGDLSTRVAVVSGDEMGELAASFNEMVRGLEEREALMEAFGSYVDPEVADRVLREGELLEGEQVEATMLFVDICDFTAFAENASAREAVALLNEFFGLIVPVVIEARGHANKFIGDGMLAVFGAPDRRDDHADCAVEAAVKIADAVEERYGTELEVAMGINSGPVMVGTVGGGGRLEFTVIGDPVNVAARVEETTRDTGDKVLVTESTRALLGDTWRARLDERGSIPLKGKSEPVPLYAVRGGGTRPAATDTAAATGA